MNLFDPGRSLLSLSIASAAELTKANGESQLTLPNLAVFLVKFTTEPPFIGTDRQWLSSATDSL